VNRILLTAIDVVQADLQADGAPRHTGPDFGKASPMGLLVIVLLLLGTVFLIRSMNTQLKKVPKSFDRENPASDQTADEGTLGAGDQASETNAGASENGTGTDRSPHEPDNRASGPGDEPG
jgi:hypothetical protein